MKISLIVPCYNETSNLQKGVLDKIGNYVERDDRFIEVLIVDDGSTDGSKKMIRDNYLPAFSKFKLVENPHRGKAYAVIAGMEKAKGDYVMFMDIDLATPIEESEKLIRELEDGYKIVIGSRSSERKGAPALRKVMAVGNIFIRSVFIGLRGVRDTQCGFKVFDRKTALSIIKKLRVFGPDRNVKDSSVSAGFDLEFLFIAQKMQFKLKEVPVTWRHVETKNVKFIKDSLQALKDMWAIKKNDMDGNYN